MNTRHILALLVASQVPCAGAVAATPAHELLELINTYRAAPRQCDGRERGPVAPLAPEAALASLKLSDAGNLQDALRAAGYQAARAQALTLSGPRDAKAAMRFIEQRNCALLLNKYYTAAGIARNGNNWQIVFAQPLLAPDLGDWGAAGKQVLERVNVARSQARRCGERQYRAAPALKWNAQLGQAALAHSRDMAQNNYFSHTGRDDSTVGDRAQRHGYSWRRVGENIATGQGSPQQVVAGWLTSPGHCANLMNPEFTEMGAAYAINPDSDTTIYWTQVFGTPR